MMGRIVRAMLYGKESSTGVLRGIESEFLFTRSLLANDASCNTTCSVCTLVPCIGAVESDL